MLLIEESKKQKLNVHDLITLESLRQAKKASKQILLPTQESKKAKFGIEDLITADLLKQNEKEETKSINTSTTVVLVNLALCKQLK